MKTKLAVLLLAVAILGLSGCGRFRNRNDDFMYGTQCCPPCQSNCCEGGTFIGQ